VNQRSIQVSCRALLRPHPRQAFAQSGQDSGPADALMPWLAVRDGAVTVDAARSVQLDYMLLLTEVEIGDHDSPAQLRRIKMRFQPSTSLTLTLFRGAHACHVCVVSSCFSESHLARSGYSFVMRSPSACPGISWETNHSRYPSACVRTSRSIGTHVRSRRRSCRPAVPCRYQGCSFCQRSSRVPQQPPAHNKRLNRSA